MRITEKQIEEMAAEYAESENSEYTNDYYGFINGFKKALTLCGVELEVACEHKYKDNVCDNRGVRKCLVCSKLYQHDNI